MFKTNKCPRHRPNHHGKGKSCDTSHLQHPSYPIHNPDNIDLHRFHYLFRNWVSSQSRREREEQKDCIREELQLYQEFLSIEALSSGSETNLSSRLIFYPSFSNIIPSFHTISLHNTRQDKPNAIHCTGLTNPQDYKQDQRLVLLCNTRPPTKTVYAIKELHTCFGLLIVLPQDESSSEVPLLTSAGRFD